VKRLLGAIAALLAAAAGFQTAPALSPGAAGPIILPTGQPVTPAGQILPLQNFPTGAAVSPDGSTVLAIAGLPSAVGQQRGLPSPLPQPPATLPGVPQVELVAMDVATGAVRQVLNVTDAFQSVVWRPDGSQVLVAGGVEGNVHVFNTSPAGILTRATDIAAGCDFVSGIALVPGGQDVWAACPNAGLLRHLSPAGQVLASYSVPSPDMVALSPDGSTVYATDWRGSSVAAVDVATGTVSEVQVGDHPTGIVVLPDGTVVVADANDATLATIEPGTLVADLTSLALVGRQTDAPNYVAAGPDGRLYVTLGGDNAVAVLRRPHSAQPVDDTTSPRFASSTRGAGWHVAGYIPTGWYPTAVALSPDGTRINIVTARGLAQSAAATMPYVNPDPVSFGIDAAYFTVGTLERLDNPDSGQLASLTKQVTDNNRRSQAVGGNPVYMGPAGPIKHVIYITRENKTYDADLGDLHPGPGNALVLFGKSVTPNLHELETTFSESQNFYYPGWKSEVGHMWEDAGAVSDIEDRAALHPGLNSDWHDPTNYPGSGLLVEQAWRAGLTVRTYNEELAQQSGLLPSQFQADESVYPNYDLQKPDAGREAGWETEFAQFEKHVCTGALAATYGSACQLPSLEYVYLGGDHTTVVDEPGYPTIQAQVADNDYATGKVIDAVSHSADWNSTLVIVVEDDPQGTGDHISAYHGFIALASPYVKRNYVSTVHYELPSIVGAIDSILGLPPLTDYAARSRPLDDMFTSQPDATRFTVDGSGIATYPFTPLPGVPPSSDAAHGIYGFNEPDLTDPAITNDATWMQVRGISESDYFATVGGRLK